MVNVTETPQEAMVVSYVTREDETLLLLYRKSASYDIRKLINEEVPSVGGKTLNDSEQTRLSAMVTMLEDVRYKSLANMQCIMTPDRFYKKSRGARK